MTWMQTASGMAFDLVEAPSIRIDRDDVIHQLARINRFSGATKGEYGYTVLQHSHLVATLLERWGAPPIVCLEGAFHECGEPYVGDITRPVQLAVAAIFREQLAEVGARHLGAPAALDALRALQTDPLTVLRHRVDRAARIGLGLPPEETRIVKRADNVALAIEKRDLMVYRDDWNLAEYAPLDVHVTEVWRPMVAIARFRELVDKLDAQIEARASEDKTP